MDITKIKILFDQVRTKKPLIHHITNKVTINDCANVTLAIGASPVMADFHEEVEEMVGHASALLLNFGMLNDGIFKSMLKAGKKANENGIPVIFDPVGVGGTSYRTKRAHELMSQINISIIRGNHSEIASLLGFEGMTRGVDTGDVTSEIQSTALKACTTYNSVVVISGKKDVVTNGNNICFIHNGHEWLPKVTGTGCSSTSLIAAFSGVTTDYYSAAIAGISTMGICGENVMRNCSVSGLGTFKIKLLDEISTIDGSSWAETVCYTL
ncbi:hydroxyethylthiazole kinase [Bacillus sp. Marseille-P3661]|uniref:hydroxyethylthiazole kinase n=1 Tax=Bacillus sp. Marseille-P3661 TaxID=1936234 RepID=UPI000C8147B8|nr:hydroxyethylthiazole kinase [Bacillus sp. Marseille-P3661]